jgi:hypothetical protein
MEENDFMKMTPEKFYIRIKELLAVQFNTDLPVRQRNRANDKIVRIVKLLENNIDECKEVINLLICDQSIKFPSGEGWRRMPTGWFN